MLLNCNNNVPSQLADNVHQETQQANNTGVNPRLYFKTCTQEARLATLWIFQTKHHSYISSQTSNYLIIQLAAFYDGTTWQYVIMFYHTGIEARMDDLLPVGVQYGDVSNKALQGI